MHLAKGWYYSLLRIIKTFISKKKIGKDNDQSSRYQKKLCIRESNKVVTKLGQAEKICLPVTRSIISVMTFPLNRKTVLLRALLTQSLIAISRE